jgi:ADP-ribose diphosphatase
MKRPHRAAAKARVLSSKTLYRGRVVTLKLERVAEPGGVIAQREVVSHPGAVVILPHFADGRLLLVRQYRHAAGQALWELVAGTLEPGESPLEAAGRELMEETGFDAKVLRPILDFFPSPGVLSERMYLIEARGLARCKAHPDPDERIQTRRFTPSQLQRMLEGGKLCDGKTLVGLLWYFWNMRRHD